MIKLFKVVLFGMKQRKSIIVYGSCQGECLHLLSAKKKKKFEIPNQQMLKI